MLIDNIWAFTSQSFNNFTHQHSHQTLMTIPCIKPSTPIPNTSLHSLSFSFLLFPRTPSLSTPSPSIHPLHCTHPPVMPCLPACLPVPPDYHHNKQRGSVAPVGRYNKPCEGAISSPPTVCPSHDKPLKSSVIKHQGFIYNSVERGGGGHCTPPLYPTLPSPSTTSSSSYSFPSLTPPGN